MRLPAGATMAYPPGWRRAQGDAGSATQVLSDAHGQLIGYLNLTSRTVTERLRTWPAFRLAHNRREHDMHLHRLAAAGGLRVGDGTGACVLDRYTTVTARQYTEIACLVVGRRRGVVVVAAAPTDAWGRIAPRLQRAVASVRT
ncbi:MAG TPA: hypothetical protein VF781_06000 [Solirubrobacteraceae bacterium]